MPAMTGSCSAPGGPHGPDAIVLRHGVDLIEVARIRRMLETHGARFVSRCFRPGEVEYADRGKKRRAEHYAVRFACKEALLKALGTGWRGGISWQDMEVVRDANGAPGLHLHGRCRELAAELGIRSWAISLSHTEELAMAIVIGWGSSP
jgi:holo-[acyl-carrier protein] synthase